MSMRFAVPQFIDVEDKIIGPISVRQFITILIGAGLVFVAYKLLSFFSFIPVGFVLFVVIGMFAFGRVNGQPFHLFLLSLIQTLKSPKLKAWSKIYIHESPSAKKEDKSIAKVLSKAPLSSSRLTQLGLIVDTGGAFKPDEENGQELTTIHNP